MFKNPSVEEFAKDLASCRGIITNGGFTLISEAIYLKKPIYSVPVKNQMEQEINAYYLEKEGYGISSRIINKKTLEKFIKNLKTYEKNLKKYNARVNDFSLVDEKIDLLVKS